MTLPRFERTKKASARRPGRPGTVRTKRRRARDQKDDELDLADLSDADLEHLGLCRLSTYAPLTAAQLYAPGARRRRA